MGERARKLMSMHKALHLWDRVVYICQEKKRGRDLSCIEDCVHVSTVELEDNIKKNNEILIRAAKNSVNNINTDRKTEQTRK